MKAIVSHPHGNANLRAVLRGLHRAGLLARFVTTLGFAEDRPVPAWLPGSLRAELNRRAYPLPRALLATAPLRETIRLAATRQSWPSLTAHERGWASIDAVWRETDRRTAALVREGAAGPDLGAVYAYEDGALETFRAAKRRGLACIYDLPIGFHRSAQRLFAEERELMPEFAASLTGLHDSPEKLARKQEEIELADRIVACSPFVAETLTENGIPAAKIEPVQFGVAASPPLPLRPPLTRTEPLKLLFVGRIGQRKGIGYLLKAMESFRPADLRLTLLGTIDGPPEALQPYAARFDYLPPRPQAEVFQIMAQHDLLVLPSLFEGQALVILEAMQCGLPVLITPNTGAAHLVEEGRNGFVVPIRSPERIAERLAWCLEHRDQLRAMGDAARETAGHLTWRSYEESIVRIIREGMISSAPSGKFLA